MDLNELFHDHQLSLMRADQAGTARERLAHHQFAADYAAAIQTVRAQRGLSPRQQGPAPTELVPTTAGEHG